MKDIEIFEKVKTHLLTQMQRSVNAGGECRYRGDNGTMCAAGCLIKDEFYDLSFESQCSNVAKVHFAITQSIGDFGNNADVMIRNLQSLHDVKLPEDWEYYLDTFDFTSDGEYIIGSYTGQIS